MRREERQKGCKEKGGTSKKQQVKALEENDRMRLKKALGISIGNMYNNTRCI